MKIQILLGALFGVNSQIPGNESHTCKYEISRLTLVNFQSRRTWVAYRVYLKFAGAKKTLVV